MTWLLDRITREVMLGIVMILAVAAFVMYIGKTQAERLQAKAETELANYRLEVSQATLVAQEQVRLRERAAQLQAERVAQNADKNQQILARRLDGVNIVVASLRDEIDRLNARPVPESTDDPRLAAYAGEARIARELLGSCAEEYRSMAKAADELRDQVIGLQDFAKTVTQPTGK
jgi:hypothetical protein